MFYVLSKILDVALSPLTWALVLLALALPAARGRAARSPRVRRRKRALGALGLAVLFVCSTPYVDNAISWSLERSAASTYDREAVYDVVILLGGVGDERVWSMTGEPSLNENVERLVATHRLLRDGHARYAIVSGGVNDALYQAFNEAAMLAGMLRDWGIAGERVIVEDQAKNTRENALLSAAIVRERGFRRVLVVTSAFHVPRSMDCFRAVGLDADFLAVDHRAIPPVLELRQLLPRAEALFRTSAAIRELSGRAVYRARGYGKGAP